MPKMTARITRAQVAAFCALVLAGQTRQEAASVVGESYSRLRPYLPDDWQGKGPRARLCALSRMRPDERRLYKKLRANGVSRDASLSAVFP